jgi:hypothetical protein
MAATAQGSAVAEDLCATVGCVPTAVPQRWQNFAPGERSERQPAQTASPTAAPHSEQYRPVVGAAQVGQGFSVEVAAGMRKK